MSKLDPHEDIADVCGLGLVLAIQTRSSDVATQLRQRIAENGAPLHRQGEASLVVPPPILDIDGAGAAARASDCAGSRCLDVTSA